MIFIHGLGMFEGVGDDSRHEIEHVDIQLGSCIFLNVFGFHYLCISMRSNSCRRLSLLDIAHPVEGT